MRSTITRAHLIETQLGQSRASSKCCVAVHGLTYPSICSPMGDSSFRRTLGIAMQVFVVHGRPRSSMRSHSFWPGDVSVIANLMPIVRVVSPKLTVSSRMTCRRVGEDSRGECHWVGRLPTEVLLVASPACDGVAVAVLKSRENFDRRGQGAQLTRASRVGCFVIEDDGLSCESYSSVAQHSRYYCRARE